MAPDHRHSPADPRLPGRRHHEPQQSPSRPRRAGGPRGSPPTVRRTARGRESPPPGRAAAAAPALRRRPRSLGQPRRPSSDRRPQACCRRPRRSPPCRPGRPAVPSAATGRPPARLRSRPWPSRLPAAVSETAVLRPAGLDVMSRLTVCRAGRTHPVAFGGCLPAIGCEYFHPGNGCLTMGASA
jgi:hypothetical protein